MDLVDLFGSQHLIHFVLLLVIGRLLQDCLQFIVVALIGQIIVSDVVDLKQITISIEDENIPLQGVPDSPDIFGIRILKKGQIPSTTDCRGIGVSARTRIDADNLDLTGVGEISLQVILYFIQFSKLALAISSARLCKVPGGNFSAIIRGREETMIRRRIGVFIAECKGWGADPSDRRGGDTDRWRIPSASEEK